MGDARSSLCALRGAETCYTPWSSTGKRPAPCVDPLSRSYSLLRAEDSLQNHGGRSSSGRFRDGAWEGRSGSGGHGRDAYRLGQPGASAHEDCGYGCCERRLLEVIDLQTLIPWDE